MKWTEDEARRFFEPSPKWAGRRSSNWEPAQVLIAALDQSHAQVAKLERVNRAAFDYMEMGSQIDSSEYRELLAALTAVRLEASDE